MKLSQQFALSLGIFLILDVTVNKSMYGNLTPLASQGQARSDIALAAPVDATTTPAPTATLAPTTTPAPTATLAPTATRVPTVAPLPTATPKQTATPKPTVMPKPTPPPQPAPVPRPTSTPVQTPTPRPTSTPQSTSTPRPSSTPIPTRTATPTTTPLPQQLSVTTTSDAKACPGGPGNPGYSLRCAINQMNQGNAGRTVSFQIPSSDPGCGPSSIRGESVRVCTIALTGPLPALTADNSTIDGYSQQGAAPNSKGASQGGSNSVITVRLDGAGSTGGALILRGGAHDTVKGLSFTNFQSGPAVSASGSTSTVIQGNLIGIAPDGTRHGNLIGINMSSADNAVVGGILPEARNVISGNSSAGVVVVGSRNDSIRGNDIGSGVTGAKRAANGIGIQLSEVSNTSIGGTDNSAKNVISGNAGDGLVVRTGTNINITGNFVGTSPEGATSLGNHGDGIAVSDISSKVTINQNVIGYNQSAGIYVGQAGSRGTASVEISRNSFTADKGAGIDIIPTGRSNCIFGLRNLYASTPCPNIQSATATRISGTACKACTVEVYIATDSPGDGGFGEGKTFLGRVSAKNGTWVLKLALGRFNPSAQRVTATATTSSRSPATSEFALNMPVTVRFDYVRLLYTTAHVAVSGRSGKVQRVTQARTVRVAVTFEWKVPTLTGIAGFNLYAGQHKLNPQFIAARGLQAYRYTVRWKGPGPFVLAVILDNRLQIRVRA